MSSPDPYGTKFVLQSVQVVLLTMTNKTYKKIHKEIRNNKYLREHIYNDYNTVFLPKTQYEKLKIIKNKILTYNIF